MLKVFAALVTASALWAQIDITVPPSRGPFFDVARGVAWGGSNVGGLNNAYRILPNSPDAGMCVYVTNLNPTNTHSIAMTLYGSGDQKSRGFLASSTYWTQLATWSVATVATLGTTSQFFQTAGSGQLTLNFSGNTTQAGNPDTADVYVAFANNAFACPPGAGAGAITLQTGTADIVGDGSAHSLSGIGTFASWVQFIGLPTNIAYFRVGDSTINTTRGAAVGPGAGMFLPPIAQGRYYDMTMMYYLAAVGDKISIVWAK